MNKTFYFSSETRKAALEWRDQIFQIAQRTKDVNKLGDKDSKIELKQKVGKPFGTRVRHSKIDPKFSG